MAVEVKRTAHVPDWKVEEVQELIEKISQNRVVGVAGIREIPASNLQQMRGGLRERIEVRVVRNTIAKRALENSAPEVRPLAEFVEDQTALIFCDDNPFKLYAIFEKSKRPMPIKAGSRSPKNIVIERGETTFSPGPMVGKLQAAGISAAIKGGKVVINQQITLVKEGEIVSSKIADILKDMEIFPKNVGINLRAAYEGGLVFHAKDLALDVQGIISQFSLALAEAFVLALEVAYATPQTVAPLLQKAQTRARALVTEIGIPVPDMMEFVLLKAAANAQAIESIVSGAKIPVQAPSVAAMKETKFQEENKQEKKESEEEEAGAEGLGALFG